MKTFGGIGVDKWGGVMLICAVGSVALIYMWFSYLRWRAGRGRMNSVVSRVPGAGPGHGVAPTLRNQVPASISAREL